MAKLNKPIVSSSSAKTVAPHYTGKNLGRQAVVLLFSSNFFYSLFILGAVFAIIDLGLTQAADNLYGPTPNCTWFAWQRWHDWGVDLPSNLGDAAYWADNAAAAGYSVGTEPQERAIMVLSDPCQGCVRDGTGDVPTAGHVAIIISVNGDSLTVRDQAFGRPETLPYRESIQSLASLRANQPHLKFIYFPGYAYSVNVGQGSGFSANYVEAYNRAGGAAQFGNPTATVQFYPSNNSGVTWQRLSGGAKGNAAIFHHEGGGGNPASIRAYVVSGRIYDQYMAMGGPNSWLGAPTTDMFSNMAQLPQVDFVGGYITDLGGNFEVKGYPAGSGWRWELYNNEGFSSGPSNVIYSSPLNFDYNWAGGSPQAGVFNEHWSGRFTRTENINRTGNYQLTVGSDDGVRLWFDGRLVIDKWQPQAYTSQSTIVTAGPGLHQLKLEYYQIGGASRLSFKLESIPYGFLDGANCTNLVGWAWDTEAPTTPIMIHIYKDNPGTPGSFVGAYPANIYRNDLANVLGYGQHGFIIPLPPSLKDGQPHNIYAYGINIGSGSLNPLLGGSPRTIHCN